MPKIDQDLLMKIGAVAVAAWLLVSPYLPQIKRAVMDAFAMLARPAPPQPAAQVGTVEDMKTILEMADRLRIAGNFKAVDACQELIDLMLHGEDKK